MFSLIVPLACDPCLAAPSLASPAFIEGVAESIPALPLSLQALGLLFCVGFLCVGDGPHDFVKELALVLFLVQSAIRKSSLNWLRQDAAPIATQPAFPNRRSAHNQPNERSIDRSELIGYNVGTSGGAVVLSKHLSLRARGGDHNSDQRQRGPDSSDNTYVTMYQEAIDHWALPMPSFSCLFMTCHFQSPSQGDARYVKVVGGSALYCLGPNMWAKALFLVLPIISIAVGTLALSTHRAVRLYRLSDIGVVFYFGNLRKSQRSRANLPSVWCMYSLFLMTVDAKRGMSDENTRVVETNVKGEWSIAVPLGFTTADIDEIGPCFPDDVAQTDGTDPTTVTAIIGQDIFTVNDGFYRPDAVSAQLYLHLNANADQDPGEPNLPDVMDVLVTASNGTVIRWATHSNGNWFTAVPPGGSITDIDETNPEYPSGSVQTEGNDPTTVLALGGQDKFTDDNGCYYSSPSNSPSKSSEPSKEPSNVPSRSSLPSVARSEIPSRSPTPSQSSSSVSSQTPAQSQSPTLTCNYEKFYIDFERESAPEPGTELSDGAHVQKEWFGRYGMTVTASPEGPASSEGVEALVVDLDEPHEEVLTIVRPGWVGKDESNQAGGNITFTFAAPAVGLIDLDPAGTGQVGRCTVFVEKADESGTLVMLDVPLLSSAGGSSSILTQNVTIDEKNVRSVTVE